MHRPNTTQDATNHRAIMARVFPELYRERSAAEQAEAERIARYPIEGMLYAIGQTVVIGSRRGTVESCTVYPDGRFKYVIQWHNGDRQWVWETSLKAVEGER